MGHSGYEDVRDCWNTATKGSHLHYFSELSHGRKAAVVIFPDAYAVTSAILFLATPLRGAPTKCVRQLGYP